MPTGAKKGYLLEGFAELFRRYLPSQSATSTTSLQDKDLGDNSIRDKAEMSRIENERNSLPYKGVADVADPNGDMGGMKDFSEPESRKGEGDVPF